MARRVGEHIRGNKSGSDHIASGLDYIIVKPHPAHTLLLRDYFRTTLICDFPSKPFSSPDHVPAEVRLLRRAFYYRSAWPSPISLSLPLLTRHRASTLVTRTDYWPSSPKLPAPILLLTSLRFCPECPSALSVTWKLPTSTFLHLQIRFN